MSRAFPPGKPPAYAKIGSDVRGRRSGDDGDVEAVAAETDVALTDRRDGRQPEDAGGDDEVARERTQQQVERQKQDESLDELHSAVKRLGDMSLSISTELDTQNKCGPLPHTPHTRQDTD